jgi:hypothetical protein
VINFEPPWNPARLEQRIGRVHRLGQAHPVQVIHLLTEKTIEERVWETLELKKSLFAGVFDSPTAEVSFAKLGRKSVLQAVKEVFADQPGRPKPIVDSAPPQPIPVVAAAAPAPVAAAPNPAQSAETVATPFAAVAPGETSSGTSAVAAVGLRPEAPRTHCVHAHCKVHSAHCKVHLYSVTYKRNGWWSPRSGDKLGVGFERPQAVATLCQVASRWREGKAD